jgi:hypothetical protein
MASQLEATFAAIDIERRTLNVVDALAAVGMDHGYFPLTDRFTEFEALTSSRASTATA